MSDHLHVYRDPPLDGPTNMGRDECLLYDPAVMPAALRIYYWDPPTLSLGYFQRFAEIDSLPHDVRGLAVVRRPTGGGAILHDREITYGLMVDAALPIARQAPDALYRLAHEAWLAVLAADGVRVEMAPEDWPMPSPRSGPFFCFEKPGRTDLIVGGAKLLGSAQRRLAASAGRVGGRVLQHGSLLTGRRFAAHPGHDLGDVAQDVRERWIVAFIDRVARGLDLAPRDASWTPEQLTDARERAARYAGDAWTRLR